MKKYALHPDLFPLAYLRPPVSPAILPACNALLSLVPVRSDRKVAVTRGTLPAADGTHLPWHFFEPVGLPRPTPCLVLYHGGGFAVKAAPYHYELARQYALEARCKVLLPDYRLAPDHPFPTPPEDCYAAYLWARENASLLGIDPRRIAVGGDSAGGTLSAACCLMARDRGQPLPCFQMLLYPAISRKMDTPSMALFQDTPMWNAKKNRAMLPMYIPDMTLPHLEYAVPEEAPSLAGLPPAFVETAEFDCLRDEGARYARLLAQAGNQVELEETKGTLHAYDSLTSAPVVRRQIRRRAAALQAAFQAAEPQRF